MRSLYPNGTDENLLAVENWACDRTPLETFDELYEGLSQTHSPGGAEAFAYNVSHAAHETLCPGIEINGNYSGTRLGIPKTLAAIYSVQEYFSKL